ncbi:MAG: D-alanyl-D-alanine carboxypeptidase [Chloroflexota bacterium]|nr:D-alanyl-D-alanine carboxypeptidase [Chloroflexota bacterium]
MDTGTGRVLWGKAPDKRLPMASTTKMMTALLAAELADPDEVATVYPRDLVSGSTVSLRKGERLTIEQLLYGALLQSGNDAAVTIADHVGREYLGGVGDDGIQTFVRAMNARARTLGLTNTQFKNPNGFDEPGHYSTARDLARLGRELLANPLLAGIVSTAQYRLTGYIGAGPDSIPVYHTVRTTNELLGSYRGANGIKTGTTPQAGEALVASVQRGDSSLIAVMLGSTNRFADARMLFDWGFDRFEWLPVTPTVFDSPIGAAVAQQRVFAAVEKWNTDLAFFNAGAGATRYWLGTEPLDIPSVVTVTP